MVLLFLYSFMFGGLSATSLMLSMLHLSMMSVTLEASMPQDMEIYFSMNFDFISLMFFSVVSMISSTVFLYSKFYMDQEWVNNSKNNYFFILMFSFVASMFFLIFSNSWVMVMVGWDGLGITSFLLVIFYNNSPSLDSGMVTIMTNRIGDCLFILSFMFMYFNSWFNMDFLTFSNFSLLMFSLTIFLGAITKSAQLPFSSWLPAAMAAPTPVSSLVHSSTLVTAGVFVTLRFNYLLSGSFMFFSILALTTMILGGVCAMMELDFKKVVAMSTLSQLGFMLFTITSGYWLISFFHMMFHAFFKSCLFLSTGNLMHFLLSDQDSRNFGCMGGSLFSSAYFTASVVSLMGFPFSLGFYSKDVTLSTSLSASNSIINCMFILGCCCTVAYSYRLISMSFMNFSSFNPMVNFKEMNYFFTPLTILYSSCVFTGNFFFYSFFPPTSFSFFELSVGVFILLVGLLVMTMFYLNFFFKTFVSNLSFITSMIFLWNSLMPRMHSKMDYSWGEIYSGSGVKKSLESSVQYLNQLLKMNTWLMLSFFILLVTLLL